MLVFPSLFLSFSCGQWTVSYRPAQNVTNSVLSPTDFLCFLLLIQSSSRAQSVAILSQTFPWLCHLLLRLHLVRCCGSSFIPSVCMALHHRELLHLKTCLKESMIAMGRSCPLVSARVRSGYGLLGRFSWLILVGSGRFWPTDHPPPRTALPRTALHRTALRRTAQNFALFFLLPPTFSFFSLSGDLLVECWWCFGLSGPQMCLFSPSGCLVEPPAACKRVPLFRHLSRQPHLGMFLLSGGCGLDDSAMVFARNCVPSCGSRRAWPT